MSNTDKNIQLKNEYVSYYRKALILFTLNDSNRKKIEKSIYRMREDLKKKWVLLQSILFFFA